MLVLNRKLGERIFICNDIVVTVVGVQGGRVKLGFDCPGHIPVHREEVHLRIREERAVETARSRRTESQFLPEFA
jgi:carbon storage regulator